MKTDCSIEIKYPGMTVLDAISNGVALAKVVDADFVKVEITVHDPDDGSVTRVPVCAKKDSNITDLHDLWWSRHETAQLKRK
jgi:hypothetical protein